MNPVYAQGINSEGDPPQITLLADIIIRLVDSVWPFVGLAVLALLIYGGAMWMLSSGDPQKLAKARGTIMWAVIGAVIIACIMAFMSMIANLVGIDPGCLFTIRKCEPIHSI